MYQLLVFTVCTHDIRTHIHVIRNKIFKDLFIYVLYVYMKHSLFMYSYMSGEGIGSHYR